MIAKERVCLGKQDLINTKVVTCIVIDSHVLISASYIIIDHASEHLCLYQVVEAYVYMLLSDSQKLEIDTSSISASMAI